MQNAGSAARTCAATSVALHLVGPLGFQVDDRKLKRAGLDYWDFVVGAPPTLYSKLSCLRVRVYGSWQWVTT